MHEAMKRARPLSENAERLKAEIVHTQKTRQIESLQREKKSIAALHLGRE